MNTSISQDTYILPLKIQLWNSNNLKNLASFVNWHVNDTETSLLDHMVHLKNQTSMQDKPILVAFFMSNSPKEPFPCIICEEDINPWE